VYRIWVRRNNGSEAVYKTADSAEQAVRMLPPRHRKFVTRVELAGSAAYRGYDDAA
jgi:hypothetical protein